MIYYVIYGSKLDVLAEKYALLLTFNRKKCRIICGMYTHQTIKDGQHRDGLEIRGTTGAVNYVQKEMEKLGQALGFHDTGYHLPAARIYICIYNSFRYR